MIIRLITSFLFGFILVALLDFVMFIGMKLNYFDYYDIKEYFNVIFFDNQNFPIFLILALAFGYLMMYSKFAKIFDVLYIIMLLFSITTLYSSVGKSVGERFFLEKDKEISTNSTEFIGDILYRGRDAIYIKRDGVEKAIKINRDDVTILN